MVQQSGFNITFTKIIICKIWSTKVREPKAYLAYEETTQVNTCATFDISQVFSPCEIGLLDIAFDYKHTDTIWFYNS